MFAWRLVFYRSAESLSASAAGLRQLRRTTKKAAVAASSVSLRPELAETLHVAVLLAEALNATSGINDTLLTGVERMASGANFDVDAGLANCGARLERIAAAANNIDFGVFRMDFGFHVCFPGCGR